MHFAYINTETMEYPVHEGDIRLLYPGISETLTGETFPAPTPFAPVSWVERPTFDALNELADQTTPELVNGKWQVKWNVRPLTPQEKAIVDELERKRQEQLAVPEDE